MPVFAPTWTTERLERLKHGFDAGLSCSQIAAEIGVSRNAVIGKLSRLSLTRNPRVDTPPRHARAPLPASQRARPGVKRQLQLLESAYGPMQPVVAETAIDTAHRCSLFDLKNEQCRWPIDTSEGDDISFCGNATLGSLSYCPGHARLAYRAGSQQRAMRR